MIKKAVERWRNSRAIEVGHRFQARYHSHRRRREQGQTSKYGRLFNVAGGPALIVAGLAFIPTPGPSYIIIMTRSSLRVKPRSSLALSSSLLANQLNISSHLRRSCRRPRCRRAHLFRLQRLFRPFRGDL